MNKKIFIANWKMYRSFAESIAWAAQHTQEIAILAEHNTIIICPEFTALAPLGEQFKETSIKLGAQNCSEQSQPGAFTGQVAAQSLKEVGCTYCIVGHWEQYHYQGETIIKVAARAQALLAVDIQPIICVHEQNLDEQLEAILSLNAPSLIIAYEPTKSIGTGKIPPISALQTAIDTIHSKIATALPSGNFSLVYGGSVMPDTIKQLTTLKHIDGFLIGCASLDFQKFKNIVTLTV